MNVSVASWVHRTIRSQDRFVDARDDDTIQSTYAWVGVPVIGVYQNPPGLSPAEIVITDGFMLTSGDAGQTRIPFDEIEGIRAPDKGSGGCIHLEHKSGEHINLVIGGRQGKFEDVYEFVRFLRRVTDERHA